MLYGFSTEQIHFIEIMTEGLCYLQFVMALHKNPKLRFEVSLIGLDCEIVDLYLRLWIVS